MGWGFVVVLLTMAMVIQRTSSIRANWGTQASHPLPPDTVVRMLRDNNIQKVKLFDAEYDTLKALGESRIEVMVGIPNEMLSTLASSLKAAEKWVAINVSTHISTNNVNIRYVAVGNEPFLSSYNGSYLNTTFPALRNIQTALTKAGLQNQVKVTCPLNADVYETSTTLPSGGNFRANIHDLMITIVKFLSENDSPFTVNIYPFISLYNDDKFPIDYALGVSKPLSDGETLYNNMFDANYDTLVHALEKNGFGKMPIVVGEIGWPTGGDKNANVEFARKFNQGFMDHISGGKGTPKRPGPIDAYLFSLIDEDRKSVEPGYFERHWGLFTFDGLPKYAFNLGTTNTGALVQAKEVNYLMKKWCVMKPNVRLDDPQVAASVSFACSRGDCTSLGVGTSCGKLDGKENVSYAFNSYYQMNDQEDKACKFSNISEVTKTDPSTETCRFPIMILPYYSEAAQGQVFFLPLLMATAIVLLSVF
ncbi:unnamed protein product [Eruca vesicaria subsp. sativa]|uniref:glucan endo-1,3-beta-D-glucosidase n=1 Tax=Eruca vesicaria subsp. sativa TaxID=29727 RepID=A0ABC8LSM9_ERUVS|nr:unnamed protein product [Eruca vesicaria subsp. sativa]